MKIPLSWLAEYVDTRLPPQELADRLTLAGLEVSSFEDTGETWRGCLIGQILDINPHPNADRLSLCQVNLQDSSPTIVCGAPNISVGQKVVFAQIGAILSDPKTGERFPVRSAKIRGIVSEGILCSQKELDLGSDHTGLMILPENAPIGSRLSTYLGDIVLELDPTPNRPDCLSILGVAHEVGAIEKLPVSEPDLAYHEIGDPIGNDIDIKIIAPELCYRYTASLVKGITVGASPQWLQQRLMNAGLRPINNVVDVTNYVMLEYGQPLHSFDYDSIHEKQIVIRRAGEGEIFEGLDDIRRPLTTTMLTIADPKRVIGLAGVLGGSETEINEHTTSVLLESASFHPFNTRRTIAALKLRTEASLRFEKGVRPHLPPMALRRATQLLIQLAGGEASKGIIDIYPDRQAPPVVTLNLTKLENTLGLPFELTNVKTVLSSIGFQSESHGDDILSVSVPYWRADIAIEADLIEEVARITGYDQIPSRTLPAHSQDQIEQPVLELKERIRDILVTTGLQEIITYPLVSLREYTAVNPGSPENLKPWRVLKPISADHEYLRSNLRVGLLNTLAANQRHDEHPFSLFEVGRVFTPQVTGIITELDTAGGLLAGPSRPSSWLHGADLFGFYDVKGILEFVFRKLAIHPWFNPLNDNFFHPGRSSSVESEHGQIGRLGEIHPSVLEAFGIELSPAIFFELDIEPISQMLRKVRQPLRTPSIYPPAYRDIALIVDLRVPAAAVHASIISQPLISHATLFDVFAGEQLGQQKKSLAYKLSLQRTDRTLTAREVNAAITDLLQTLATEFGAIQRS